MWSQKKATWEGLKSNCTGCFYKKMKTEIFIFTAKDLTF